MGRRPEANVQEHPDDPGQAGLSPAQHSQCYRPDEFALWGMSRVLQAWQPPRPCCESQKCLSPQGKTALDRESLGLARNLLQGQKEHYLKNKIRLINQTSLKLRTSIHPVISLEGD